MEINSEMYTKADTLVRLKAQLKHAYIEDIFTFTVQEWQNKKETIIESIKRKFFLKKIIVRSSSPAEDGLVSSQAGCFHSELDVKVSEGEIVKAVNKVIDSYRKSSTNINEHQILIQSQTENISVSGVVFTRQIETNAPYYVINYDDQSGKSNTVTGGRAGKVIYISHFANLTRITEWAELIRAVREIESLYKGKILDIEFAITAEKKVIIFQVRYLAANRKAAMPDDDFTKYLINDMADKFERFSQRVPHLAGETTIMGDMPDWNPSEIIGSRPNTLDYTTYSFIITDEIWHEARSSLGYYDVYPAELMISFGKKPYIDTRISFNSFIPNDISFELREKLLNYYLNKLKNNLAYQDKVEFEILWTCYDFSTEKEITILSEAGFTPAEIKIFLSTLRSLTNQIIKNFSVTVAQDIKSVRFLTERRNMINHFYINQDKTPWNSFYTAYNILQNCKKFGTLPFARQARLAFIAKSFLISLKKEAVISEEFYHDFLNSIRTVASHLNNDFHLLQNGKLDKNIFLKQYGHLRAGTYDITAPRYDSSPDLFSKQSVQFIQNQIDDFSVDDKILSEISKLMKEKEIYGDGKLLLSFIRSTVESREYAKFEFTRSLSDALELIAEAGKMLGFEREELCHADLSTIMKFRNPEHGDAEYARKIIQQSIDRHRKERSWYNNIVLPPLIVSKDDFYYVAPYEAIPNFITRKSVKGDLITFAEIKNASSDFINGRIVLLENADPGFDWMFTKQPLGIITKYGGVASHMAIRCAEFSIPAAIGCGEVLYDYLKKGEVILLDCARKIVKPLTNY